MRPDRCVCAVCNAHLHLQHRDVASQSLIDEFCFFSLRVSLSSPFVARLLMDAATHLHPSISAYGY